jgi:[protein-PII] uridylyltransferase
MTRSPSVARIPFPERSRLIADTSVRGTTLCRTLASVTDDWIRQRFADALEAAPPGMPVALLAVGGYGRGELAPFSDLDLLLVQGGRGSIEATASALWYPIWDAGLKLGHAVRTVRQALNMARDDLDVGTALVTSRWLAGDAAMAQDVIDRARSAWRRRGEARLAELRRRVEQRHRTAGDVGFLLEPDLKEGRGGLRDVHALRWASEAGLILNDDDVRALERAHEVLTTVRVELHRHAGRAGEVLHLQDQDAVAAAAGFVDADALMFEVAAAARTVAWIADDVWARLVRLGLDPDRAPVGPARPVATGVVLRDGEIHLDDTVDPAVDPTLALRVATAAARHQVPIDRASLERLNQRTRRYPDPWPPGAVDDLVALLLAGQASLAAFDALDQMNLLVRILPEWGPVRSRPQRNAYHRYTVDRHLWQAAANAAALVDRVTRPDLLVLGALLHDLGKGYPGDHTEVGIDLVRVIGPRLGLPPDDVEVLEAMVRHHLLLPDVATRRDLSDDATITGVAQAVGSEKVLDLLHALTEADSLATGPAAWGDWKAGLVRALVERVRHVLGGGDVREVAWRLFPSATVLELMGQGRTEVLVRDDRLTVVSPDTPGTFSRVSGVLSLHRLAVLGAEAHSDEQGMAASEFVVVPPDRQPIDWDPVVADLRRALAGELALEARIAERAQQLRRRRQATAASSVVTRVTFDDDASTATVVEVRAPNVTGLLYRITKALADLSLDIRHARVQTLGHEVVDAFYVRNAAGTKVTEAFHRAEIERAVLHAVHSLT